MSMRLWVVLSYLEEKSNIEIIFCFNELMVQFLTTILHVHSSWGTVCAVRSWSLVTIARQQRHQEVAVPGQETLYKNKTCFYTFFVHIKQ